MIKPPYDPEALPSDLRALLPNVKQKNVAAKNTSSAQVETSVRPHMVRPEVSGGLKPGRQRPFRLMARFSAAEREIVRRKAEESGQTVHEFIRFCLLGSAYESTLDPLKRKLLKDISRELGRQGMTLNQIGHLIKVNGASPEQADSMLGIIGRSLLSAHMRIGQALTEGMTMP